MPSQASKSIPRRASNSRHKDTRAASWATGQERKKRRARTQAEAEAKNLVLRREGKLTPWEEACAERSARRAAFFAQQAQLAGGQS